MAGMKTPVFFYGGLIHPSVQQRLGLVVDRPRRASLPGFRITFEPWVNVHRSAAHIVYGLIMDVAHDMLQQVYSSLPARYYPTAVLTCLDHGQLEPSLCFVAPDMKPGAIEKAHVEALLDGAEIWRFPSAYVEQVRAFLPD